METEKKNNLGKDVTVYSRDGLRELASIVGETKQYYKVQSTKDSKREPELYNKTTLYLRGSQHWRIKATTDAHREVFLRSSLVSTIKTALENPKGISTFVLDRIVILLENPLQQQPVFLGDDGDDD